MKRLFAAACFAALSFSAFALPTVDDVQAEIGKGNYVHAEEMMREVVTARPNSARAHYVYAEILAHDQRFELAAEEVARAKKIDPALGFTQPDRFTAFEQLLQREQAAAKRANTAVAPVRDSVATPALRESVRSESSGGGVPGWVWGLGGAAIGLLVWRMFSSRQPSAPANGLASPSMAAAGPAGYNSPAYGGGPGYGPGAAPGYGAAPGAAPGRGLLGTGLAVAGGVAAGMLAEKLFEGHREPGFGSAAPGLSGMAPGLLDGAPQDDVAARELEQRPVDFGSGDGWGGGDAGDAGGGGDSSSGGDGGW